MHCHLLIPGLPPSRPLNEEIGTSLRLPALETLLARGRWRVEPGIGLAGWLCRAFVVDKQQDWPVAPITLRADGINPGDHYWLRADPVHLRVSRDRLILADSHVFRLSLEEARMLVATLNAHFSPDGLHFHALAADRWYLRLPGVPSLETSALTEAAGGYVDAHLPQGEDAPRWRALLNEIQMLLHEHPVNVAREERGEPAINSVWPWGGGKLAQMPHSPYAAMCSENALSRAFAQASGTACQPLPEGAGEWLAQAGNPRETLIVLDGLLAPARYRDAAGWIEGMRAIEQCWFEPLAKGLADGRLKTLTLHALGAQEAWEVSIRKKDLWRFWRRQKPLASFL